MMRARFLFCVVLIAGILLDIGTKAIVFDCYEDLGRPAGVIPRLLAFRCSQNRGGVWGIGQGKGWVFAGFSIVVIIAIFWVFFATPKPSTLVSLALGLVLSGAIGNLYDRLTLGYVRDFIDFHIAGRSWPTFNVADSSICIGIAILVIHIFKEEKATQSPTEVCNSKKD